MSSCSFISDAEMSEILGNVRHRTLWRCRVAAAISILANSAMGSFGEFWGGQLPFQAAKPQLVA
jgi:hypothetical protein